MAVCCQQTNSILPMGGITPLHHIETGASAESLPSMLMRTVHGFWLPLWSHSSSSYSFMHSHGAFYDNPTHGYDVVKSESEQQYNSGSGGDAGKSLDVPRNGGATGQGLRQVEQRIIDLRLRWALRRIRQRLVISFQRRCEMRLFVILRLQYLFRRRRSRIRAALTIQRFIRPILRKHVVRYRH